MKTGVYISYKKDKSSYYRSSITYKNRHISLGSSDSEEICHNKYLEAQKILNDTNITISSYKSLSALDYKKWVTLINLRDNSMYFKTPIYIRRNYFEYHFSKDLILKFDVDDLFFYSTHSIMKRGGHYFVADFGMQINILNRYGIKNYAVKDKDYKFVNGDESDFRYNNILIINRYNGVSKLDDKGRISFISKIHINGDYIIGKFRDEKEAAISYNKAIDTLKENGLMIDYQKNFIDGISLLDYENIYNNIKIPKKIRDYKL